MFFISSQTRDWEGKPGFSSLPSPPPGVYHNHFELWKQMQIRIQIQISDFRLMRFDSCAGTGGRKQPLLLMSSLPLSTNHVKLCRAAVPNITVPWWSALIVVISNQPESSMLSHYNYSDHVAAKIWLLLFSCIEMEEITWSKAHILFYLCLPDEYMIDMLICCKAGIEIYQSTSYLFRAVRILFHFPPM